jgi:hypothetical protein
MRSQPNRTGLPNPVGFARPMPLGGMGPWQCSPLWECSRDAPGQGQEVTQVRRHDHGFG